MSPSDTHCRRGYVSILSELCLSYCFGSIKIFTVCANLGNNHFQVNQLYFCKIFLPVLLAMITYYWKNAKAKQPKIIKAANVTGPTWPHLVISKCNPHRRKNKWPRRMKYHLTPSLSANTHYTSSTFLNLGSTNRTRLANLFIYIEIKSLAQWWEHRRKILFLQFNWVKCSDPLTLLQTEIPNLMNVTGAFLFEIILQIVRNKLFQLPLIEPPFFWLALSPKQRDLKSRWVGLLFG